MPIVKQNRPKIKRQDRDDLELVLPQGDSQRRRLMAFTFVVLGILANWFWHAAWAFLADQQQPFSIGTLDVVCVRLLLSLCIAALTFLPIYQKLYRLPTEDWVVCFLAFQNGFFWQSAFYGVMQHFN